MSGATRYDTFSDRVTHVIVGNPKCHELKLIKNKEASCSIVTLQWLLDSIESGQSVPEDNYLLCTSDLERIDINSSPLSKKVWNSKFSLIGILFMFFFQGLKLLRSNRTITEKEFKANLNNYPDFDEQPDNDIVQQYLRQGNTSKLNIFIF